MPRADRAQRFLIDPLAVTRDPVRRAMSPAARAAYDNLWLESWLEKVPGHLPNDDGVLARLADVTEEVWGQVRDIVRTGFDVTPTEWVCNAVLRTKSEQDIRRTKWRNSKERQRSPRVDRSPMSSEDKGGQSSVGSGSGTGTGSGAGTENQNLRQPPTVGAVLRGLHFNVNGHPSPVNGVPEIKSLAPEIAEMAKGSGAEATKTVLAVVGKLAKGGLTHRGVLLRVARHFLANHRTVNNPYAYYNLKGEGFDSIKLQMTADCAFEEHEAIKRAEREWRPQ